MQDTTDQAQEAGAADDSATPEPEQIWKDFETAESGGAARAAQPDEADGEQDRASGTDADTGDDDHGPDAGASDTDSQSDGGKDAGTSGTQEQNIWANAPPELKAAYDKAQAELEAANAKTATLEHENLSNRGRITAFQRQLDEARKGKSEDRPADDQQADHDTLGDDFFQSDEFKEMEEDYPVLAKAIKAANGSAKAVAAKMQKLEGDVTGITAERDQQFLREQYQIVVNDHADYAQIKGSPQFRAFYDKAPKYVREAIERNKDVVIDGGEVSDIVKRFKAETGFGGTSTGTGKGPGEQAPAVSGGKPSTPDPKRQQQLAGAGSPRTSSPAPVTDKTSDGDPEAIWAQFDRLEAAGR